MNYQDQHPTLFDWLDRIGTFVLPNLLWIFLSIPLVTIPVATAGLFATMSPWVRGKHVEVFQSFIGGVRQYWLKSTLIGLADLVVGGLVVFNFLIFARMDSSNPFTWLSRSVTVFVGALVLMSNLYIWPLLVVFDLPVRSLIDRSIRLVFAHPLWSFVLLAAAAAYLLVSFMLPGIVAIAASFSGCALIVHWGAWRAIRQHVPNEELVRLETHH